LSDDSGVHKSSDEAGSKEKQHTEKAASAQRKNDVHALSLKAIMAIQPSIFQRAFPNMKRS
jgi:hypothetical protein